MRVEIPAYTDDWMRGDRYGEVLGYGKRNRRTIIRVKLDKSGKVVRPLAEDCQAVD